MNEIGSQVDSSSRWTAWLDVCLILVLAVSVRLLHLDRPPHFDELYHILAARGWLETGTFALVDGEYTRVRLFTLLVAGSFAIFGESLEAARVPAVLFGTLWVILVFLWTRTHCGRIPAILTGVWLAIDPTFVQLSQSSRFYTLHGAAFWLTAIGVFELTRGPWRARHFAILALTVASGALALSVQRTTLIGFVGLAVWTIAVLSIAASKAPPGRRAPMWALALALPAGALAIALFSTGSMADLWYRYQYSPLWALDSQNNPLWYHGLMRNRFATFWALFPLAALVSLRSFGRPAAFSALVFVALFALHSGAGSKAERYIYYAMPFFFILWALALTTLVPALHRFISETARPFLRQQAARRASLAVIVVLGLFVAYNTPVNYSVRRMIIPDTEWQPYLEPDWAAAVPDLVPLAAEADVVVSSALPKAIFFLGRGDIALGATDLAELSRGNELPPDFTIDPRTGRPAIATSASIRTLMLQHASGLVIIDGNQWARECCVPPEVTDFLIEELQPVPLGPWGLHVYRWGP